MNSRITANQGNNNMDEIKRRRKRRYRYFTGEDIDMFREREQEHRSKKQENICDTNIDGA